MLHSAFVLQGALQHQPEAMGRHKTKTRRIAPPGPIAFLIPEFPGQTHAWIWREVTHMREWGVEYAFFQTARQTRKPLLGMRFANEHERRRDTFGLALSRDPGRRGMGGAHAASSVRARGHDSVQRRQHVATAARGHLPSSAAACVLAREAASLEDLPSAPAQRRPVGRDRVDGPQAHWYAVSLSLNANLEWWGGAMRSKLGDAAFTITHAEWLRDQILCDYPSLNSSRVLSPGWC